MPKIPGLIDELKTDAFEGRFLENRKCAVFTKSSIEPRVARYFTKYGVQRLGDQLLAIAAAMESDR